DVDGMHFGRNCDGVLVLFQAEDGIRVLIVTGVQTCALPISQRTIATIVRWVLEEKEEKVAPALASALRAAVGDLDDGTADPRWSAAARGAIALFEGLLDDARGHRRRDEGSVARDLAPIIDAAAPAVADALREVDAPT